MVDLYSEVQASEPSITWSFMPIDAESVGYELWNADSFPGLQYGVIFRLYRLEMRCTVDTPCQYLQIAVCHKQSVL